MGGGRRQLLRITTLPSSKANRLTAAQASHLSQSGSPVLCRVPASCTREPQHRRKTCKPANLSAQSSLVVVLRGLTPRLHLTYTGCCKLSPGAHSSLLSSLTVVPPNSGSSTVSPAFTDTGITSPLRLRLPGPTATTRPSLICTTRRHVLAGAICYNSRFI